MFFPRKRMCCHNASCMPRLTDHEYLRLHQQLHEIWCGHQQLFGWLTFRDQGYLHAYFQLAVIVPDHALLAHRRQVTAEQPSLPQCAGRAYSRLARIVGSGPPTHVRVQTFPSGRARERRLYAVSVRQPVIDAERIAKVAVAVAEAELRRSSTSHPMAGPRSPALGRSASPWSELLPSPPLPGRRSGLPDTAHRSDRDPSE